MPRGGCSRACGDRCPPLPPPTARPFPYPLTLSYLRRQGKRMMARQEQLRAMLDSEEPRLFDAEAVASLGGDAAGQRVPPQLGPLGIGTVTLTKPAREARRVESSGEE